MLSTIFKVVLDLRNDFKGGKLTVQKVGYSKESDMPKLDMRGSTVHNLNRIQPSANTTVIIPIIP